MERRDAAILVADVVGFGARVGRDEDRAIRTVKAHFAALQPMLQLHSGRIFKWTGDGFLAEFGTAVDAVSCADAMQRQMAERNGSEAAADRLDLRMGVHAGTVVVDGDDLLGEDVAIAARLQNLASPGGVALSGPVREAAQGTLEIDFDDVGLMTLRNIASPIHVYTIGPKTAVPDARRMALPDKPSLAVLPFDNLSGNEDDDYFADGVTEDIITALTYVPWIFVIARNSSFSYKGLSIDVRKVGRELGVRYVLEGSVRRGGKRLRVTGQLVDAETGVQIWANRYDGDIADLFELQDRISHAVVTAIAPEIRTAEIQRVLRKPPENLDAYDMYLRGQNAFHLGRLDEAEEWLDRSLATAPGFAKARALRAWLGPAAALYGRLSDAETRRHCLGLAYAAMEEEPADPEVVAYCGYTIGFCEAAPERGLGYLEQATERCPSFAWAWAARSMLSAFAGHAEAAIEQGEMALRLSPRDPLAFRVHIAASLAHVTLGQCNRAIRHAEKAIALNPRSVACHRHRAVGLACAGRAEEAAKAMGRVMEMDPNFSVARFIRFFRTEVGVAEPVCRAYEDGLTRAGFPA